MSLNEVNNNIVGDQIRNNSNNSFTINLKQPQF